MARAPARSRPRAVDRMRAGPAGSTSPSRSETVQRRPPGGREPSSRQPFAGAQRERHRFKLDRAIVERLDAPGRELRPGCGAPVGGGGHEGRQIAIKPGRVPGPAPSTVEAVRTRTDADGGQAAPVRLVVPTLAARPRPVGDLVPGEAGSSGGARRATGTGRRLDRRPAPWRRRDASGGPPVGPAGGRLSPRSGRRRRGRRASRRRRRRGRWAGRAPARPWPAMEGDARPVADEGAAAFVADNGERQVRPATPRQLEGLEQQDAALGLEQMLGDEEQRRRS